MIPLTLAGSVGYDEENDPYDVAQTGVALATLGHLDALEAAQSGRFDDSLHNAIRQYQTDNDLEPDGVLLPDGPTQSSLNGALGGYRAGPSLLPDQDNASPEHTRPEAIPAQDLRETGSRRESLAGIRNPILTAGGAASRDRSLLEISDQAARNLAEAQGRRMREASPDLEQIMKLSGCRYVPDPMGRIQEGDWVDDRGTRVSSEQARAITHESRKAWLHEHDGFGSDVASSDLHGVTNVATRKSVPERRIESNLRDLEYDLGIATRYVKRGESDVRVSVPISITASSLRPNEQVSRINAGIREAVVANGLLQRPTGLDEIATIGRAIAEDPEHRLQTGHSRIRDMLIETAQNGATHEQRLHARGLLAVHQLEEREAIASGYSNPRAAADTRVAAFVAGLAGEVSWSVYDPAEVDEDEDDAGGFEPAADDPENPRRPRPRGSRNTDTREAARDGRIRHRQLRDRARDKGRGWWGETEFIDPKTGKRYRFDATTPTRRGKYYILEYKPDTPTGRPAGEKQCAEYERVTGMRCRVIYYPPSSTSNSRGSSGIPKIRRPWGVGSNARINPKFPRLLLPWDPFE